MTSTLEDLGFPAEPPRTGGAWWRDWPVQAGTAALLLLGLGVAVRRRLPLIRFTAR